MTNVLSKTRYTAKVHFYGPVSEDRPRSKACVEIPRAPELATGRSALALLIPLLTLCHVLRMRVAPAPGYGNVIEQAVDEVLKSESAARNLNLMGEFDDWFLPVLPERVSEGKARTRDTFRARLRVSRFKPEILWAQSDAPTPSYTQFFALAGEVLLLEQAACDAPYAEVLVPAMLGTKRVLELEDYFYESGQPGFAGEADVTRFGLEITPIVLAKDPSVAFENRNALHEELMQAGSDR